MIDRNAGRKGKVEEAAMNNRPKKIGDRVSEGRDAMNRETEWNGYQTRVTAMIFGRNANREDRL